MPRVRMTTKKPAVRKSQIPAILKETKPAPEPKDPEIITKIVETETQTPAPKRAERTRRTTLTGFRLKMAVPEHLRRPGYVLQWWHEKDVLEAMDGGFSYVQDDKSLEVGQGVDITQRRGVDSRVSIVVGREDDGSPIRDYLMEQPEEFWLEDKASGEQKSQLDIDELRRGRDPGGQVGEDGRYDAGIKVKTTRR